MTGHLCKTEDERFKNNINFRAKPKRYALQEHNLVFRCSHVGKIEKFEDLE